MFVCLLAGHVSSILGVWDIEILVSTQPGIVRRGLPLMWASKRSVIGWPLLQFLYHNYAGAIDHLLYLFKYSTVTELMNGEMGETSWF